MVKFRRIVAETVTRQSSEVTRPWAGLSNNCILDVSSKNRRIFEKSRWTVTRQSSEATRSSADCQTTFFWGFKQIGNFLINSRWTVTRQSSEVTRPSADCQTTFSPGFKQIGNFLRKNAKRSRETVVGGNVTGRPTVEQLYSDVPSKNGEKFEKSR